MYVGRLESELDDDAEDGIPNGFYSNGFDAIDTLLDIVEQMPDSFRKYYFMLRSFKMDLLQALVQRESRD